MIRTKRNPKQSKIKIHIKQNYPTLTFTAYAVQRDANIAEIDTAAEAWALIGK